MHVKSQSFETHNAHLFTHASSYTLSRWRSSLDEYVSHTRREPNRTRHWLWTDGAPFTKPPASIGMLNIAVFICHYRAPQSLSMGPARWVTAPSKSPNTSLAFSPQLHLLPIGPAPGPRHLSGSARAAETLYKPLTHARKEETSYSTVIFAQFEGHQLGFWCPAENKKEVTCGETCFVTPATFVR